MRTQVAADGAGRQASRWQVMADTSPRVVAQRQRWDSVSGGGVVQRVVSETTARENLTKSVLSGVKTSFFAKHASTTGTLSNTEAAQHHSKRPNANGTERNTVIADLGALKTKLAAETTTWTPKDDHWDVTTADDVETRTTRKTAGDFTGRPVPDLLEADGYGPGDFTVGSGAVTAMTGVDDDELETAKARAGRYPSNKARRRAYRARLVLEVNNVRRAAHSDATAAWVRANIRSISGTPITAEDHGTTAEIDSIAALSHPVRVFIGKDEGEIFHYEP